MLFFLTASRTQAKARAKLAEAAKAAMAKAALAALAKAAWAALAKAALVRGPGHPGKLACYQCGL